MYKNILQILLFIVCSIYACRTGIAQIAVCNNDELRSALNKVKAGEVIIWKNGTYKDIQIEFKAKGEPQNIILIKAETPGKVIFTGNSQLIVKGMWLQAEGFLFEGPSTLEKGDVISFSPEASHCRITNCAVINYAPVDPLINNNWMGIQGTHNEVDHCYFKGKTNQGPYLVVRYKKEPGYVDGSDVAPSTYHHIHHNYFGYRTLPTDNGGEVMRIGDSFTSFTHGFNIIEYNYFEDHRLEPEVISNKSWNNIYRFNTFISNDGAMVLRHGQQCFVYGNYFNGTSGRGISGGIRVINPNNTVFNNYLENLEGGNEKMKAPITIMSGLEGSLLNEYYPADNAIIAYNTVVNSVGPEIRIGVGNLSKGKPLEAPKNIWIIGNTIIKNNETDKPPMIVDNNKSTFIAEANAYTKSKSKQNGFLLISDDKISTEKDMKIVHHQVDKSLLDVINKRLSIHDIQMVENDICCFNPDWKLSKDKIGVSWIKSETKF